jgi:hypothetical protein
MLFILAMEPLHKLIQVVANDGLLSPLPVRNASLRTSLYADDAAIFLNPIKEEVRVVADILSLFGCVSGLVTNQSKCAVYPIQCNGFDLDDILEGFRCPVLNFPCNYLGLSLHVWQLRRVDYQPLIDKMASRLPTWKGRFLNKSGRLKLLNTVSSSMPTYMLTALAPKMWLIKKLDKIRRGFLWKGTCDANGASSLVQWPKVKKPKDVGGLGVLDLEFFSTALRLRWLWYQWTEPDRPWVGMDVPCNDVERQLFRISTVVRVGNGIKVRFWDSAWCDGQVPRDLAPNLYRLAWRKNLPLCEELADDKWTRGLWRTTTTEEMAEFVTLWSKVQEVQLTDAEDEIRWRWSANGRYSAKSAYSFQFRGSYCSFNSKAIWKAKVEGKHRFFAWLLVQQKIFNCRQLAHLEHPT